MQQDHGIPNNIINGSQAWRTCPLNQDGSESLNNGEDSGREIENSGRIQSPEESKQDQTNTIEASFQNGTNNPETGKEATQVVNQQVSSSNKFDYENSHNDAQNGAIEESNNDISNCPSFGNSNYESYFSEIENDNTFCEKELPNILNISCEIFDCIAF